MGRAYHFRGEREAAAGSVSHGCYLRPHERFKKDWGTADEHLRLGVRTAKALGSPVFRVVLGAGEDRLGRGGIAAHIDDTVAVLKRNRSYCVDHGVKIAVENLRNLGEYALTTSLRDTALWESVGGVTAQWTAMGEGTTDLKAYFELYRKLCPGVAVNIETISGFNRELKTRDKDFWKAWSAGERAGYEKFVALARKGEPREPWKAPEGVDKEAATRDYQRGEVARSIAY